MIEPPCDTVTFPLPPPLAMYSALVPRLSIDPAPVTRTLAVGAASVPDAVPLATSMAAAALPGAVSSSRPPPDTVRAETSPALLPTLI